jgi:hypothetical protein
MRKRWSHKRGQNRPMPEVWSKEKEPFRIYKKNLGAWNADMLIKSFFLILLLV